MNEIHTQSMQTTNVHLYKLLQIDLCKQSKTKSISTTTEEPLSFLITVSFFYIGKHSPNSIDLSVF